MRRANANRGRSRVPATPKARGGWRAQPDRELSRRRLRTEHARGPSRGGRLAVEGRVIDGRGPRLYGPRIARQAGGRGARRSPRLPRGDMSYTDRNRPTAKQQAYLRSLAQGTGTSFTPPATKREASAEIKHLKGLARSSEHERRADRQAVSETSRGDEARVASRGGDRLRIECPLEGHHA